MQNDKIGIEADNATEAALAAPTFQVCLLTATKPSRLAKRIELDADGNPRKVTGGDMVEGHAQIRQFSTLTDFAQFLETLTPKQALTYGLPAKGDGPIVPRGARKEPPAGKQFRTKESFVWPAGAGVMMVDYDAPHGAPTLTKEELFSCICDAVPALVQVQVLLRPSGSSCVFREADRQQVYGVNGQRLYFVVDDAQRIPEIGAALFARLWLNGHGWLEVSKSGSALKRAPADGLVWQTNRLDFAGGAEMGDGLYQDRGDCILLGGDEPCLQAGGVGRLTPQEEHDFDVLLRKAKEAKASEIAVAKAAYIAEHAPQEAERRGIEVSQAEYLVRAVLNGAPLDGGWPLHLEDGTEATVAQILKEPEKYNGMYCCDPINPRPDQRQVAWLKLLKSKPEIFNHKTDTWYPLQTAKSVLHVVDDKYVDLAEGVAREMRKHGEFYLQGGRICTVNDDGRIVGLRNEALLHEIESICSFVGFRMENKTPVPTPKRCPEKLGQRLSELAGTGGVHLPELAGVSKHPIITAKGVLVEDEGFHTDSGVLLINPSRNAWQPIPRKPSEAEIIEAFNTLWGPFHLFPYADINAQSVALAAVLTAVIRPSLDVAPGFMFTAPSAGTGKSFLAEAIGYLAGGFSITQPPMQPVEFDKTITALLVKGQGCYILDNAVGTFGTGSFDAMLTSGKSGGRLLGSSEMVEAGRALWLITANNGQLRGDSNRRILTCYLDAKTERVLERKFSFDPRGVVQAGRGEIVRAALTLIQAWLVSPECRAAGATSGDFSQWRRMVAGCVDWLGQVLAGHGDKLLKGADGEPPRFVDPAPMLQQQLLEHDDERNLWGEALQAWADLATEGITAMSARELWALVSDNLSNARPVNATERLGAALGDCFDRPVTSPRQLGKLMAQKVNSPVDGLKLVVCGTVNGGGGKAAKRYQVVSSLFVDDDDASGATA
ncbi:hypothetical protein [Pusillimonas noertemannii]|uniref:Uncharacterized protein n=1 Tax=Pusillimonas noertemannii TaxID=305977 RepID=A0A2U1CP39_9BURK|nr:hypothetical protein [Pusillimonas noertemannii]NYT68268.1 hypothetical protein [Pusillimonas noertemannii]PVY62717.1 hypothetical protein C7440_2213 [Pusillimonas noertemannii]TFL10346.1 hypothetical protein CSC72_07335 [Pusillimonas noertemannii]